jgi:thiosulfate reductase cytochrome b subunit
MWILLSYCLILLGVILVDYHFKVKIPRGTKRKKRRTKDIHK